MALIDEAYSNAAEITGKTEEQLRAMAIRVFGSMLLHASRSPGRLIWTIAIVSPRRLDVEVDFEPRNRSAATR